MRVPVDIVTGFLGSGKTTLLRHVLQHGLDRRRVAVIVNDVAAVGIDGRVVGNLKNVETMVELDNGCICCSIDFRFEYAVQEIVEATKPDLVLIEATGVADPRILVEKIPRTRLILDAVITVVDARNVARALRESEVARRQIEEADFLVVNKTDLVAGNDVARLSRRLRRWNARAVQVCSQFGVVETPILFGTSVRQYRAQSLAPTAGPAEHLTRDGIESFVCDVGGYLDRARFERLLGELPAPVYRAKGVVWFAGEATPSLFNFTCGRSQLQWLTPAPAAPVAQGVFIGRGVAALRDRISADFLACRIASC
jgi:G3E family GTPase